MPHYASSSWALEAGTWIPNDDETGLRSPDSNAEAIFETYDWGTSNTSQTVLDIATRLAPAEIELNEVSCGAFSGLHCEWTDEEQSPHSLWVLALAEIVIVITLQLRGENSESSRQSFGRILQTLKDHRP